MFDARLWRRRRESNAENKSYKANTNKLMREESKRKKRTELCFEKIHTFRMGERQRNAHEEFKHVYGLPSFQPHGHMFTRTRAPTTHTNINCTFLPMQLVLRYVCMHRQRCRTIARIIPRANKSKRNVKKWESVRWQKVRQPGESHAKPLATQNHLTLLISLSVCCRHSCCSYEARGSIFSISLLLGGEPFVRVLQQSFSRFMVRCAFRCVSRTILFGHLFSFRVIFDACVCSHD